MSDLDVGLRLKTVREMHGLSQRALATKVGVAHSTLSLIESGTSNPSVGALKRILDGIPMELSEFFSFEMEKRESHFFRANDLVEIGKEGISYKLVGASVKNRTIQMLHETYAPGTDSGRVMLTHEGEECGVIIAGELEVTVAGRKKTLRAGEAYYFDSSLEHRFRNTGKEECVLVTACSPATF
ncbi:cupin domain-containing protein [Terasakiella sp. A23]|uniref:cupin domain-containing protein n=1 Tax=Terasakiella sp. FCG-A23 TaxID=3080561 RepID=UPI002954B938|nr:cupin domain-containing protein [Terasakiella sp. A23]MDV7340049.1 cupin domain-containing protein [Terasakiella sp. A23]